MGRTSTGLTCYGVEWPSAADSFSFRGFKVIVKGLAKTLSFCWQPTMRSVGSNLSNVEAHFGLVAMKFKHRSCPQQAAVYSKSYDCIVAICDGMHRN